MARNTTPRKQTLTYYFSVEGETEQWYLEWLEAQINANEDSNYIVKFISKVQKDPVSFVKKLVVQKKTTIWHLSDIEGSSAEQIQTVHDTLGRCLSVFKSFSDITHGYPPLCSGQWRRSPCRLCRRWL